MPHLLATSQQMQRGNADQISAGVIREESSLDLIDLRTHRTTKRDTTSIVDVQANNLAQIRDRASGGLQRVATHQSRCDYDAR